MDGPNMQDGRWCYWIEPGQDPMVHGGYVPSVVTELDDGHFPMTGDPAKMQTPWVWGKTLADAQEVCRKTNADIDAKQADLIVAKSMSLSNARR